MLDFTWKITPDISRLVNEVSALNLLFTKYYPQPENIASLLRRSILKSAVFSARIENIPARLEDPQVHCQLEVQNLVSAYNFIFSSHAPQKLSLSLIRRLHRLAALKGLSTHAGTWRQEPWAIFNSAGIAVYLAPAHFNLPRLMDEYISFIRSLKEPAPITAAIAQFAFEKIHPLADGNGRVGRLISAFVLAKSDFSHILEFEEYTDTHRPLYYQALESGKNCTGFIEFFLTSLVETAKMSLETLKQPPSLSLQSKLLPRRQELLAIIRDHPLCSFDFLSRRFPAVNPKTLHYDLLQLQKAGLVVKHGVSRASVYSSAPS